MKTTILKALAIGLLLMALPMRHFGQQPSVAQNESTIDFDITDIDRFDERIIFLYNLVNDSRFDVVLSERDGVFVVSADPSYEGMDLAATFADFKEQTILSCKNVDKEQLSEIALRDKSLLPKEYINSLMMDVYIKSRQNNLCANADPFCTDVGLYEFPAGVNAGNGESGPNYNCLSTRPNPAWYYMRIANPGGMNIYMYSTPSKDIDFCCWGPFDDPVTPCPNGLTGPKVVSCSYSSNPTETCVIPNSAQTGQYYILVITNFSNSTCNITFSKTSGSGTTDCSIMPPLVSNSGPYCVGETITLTGNAQSGATYSWSGPGGWTATGATVTRPNCTLAMAGAYTCTISLNGQTSSSETQVTIAAVPTANFNVTTVCEGSATQFTNTSTTNPSGQPISRFQWNFGDGQTSSQQNPSHTYAQPGTYQATLTVYTGTNCSDEKTKTVTVLALPTANFEATTVCEGTATHFTSSTSGATAYLWNFGDGQTGSGQTVDHTYAHPGTYQATLTVRNGSAECSDDLTKTITVYAIPNTNFTASSVCFGNDTQFTNSSSNTASQTMTYLWEFGDGVTSTDENPVHHYEAPGVYNVKLTASCGDCSHFTTHNVNVYAVPEASASSSPSVEYGNPATLSGSSGVSGNFNYHWEPANMVVDANAQTTQTIALTEPSNTFTLTVSNAENGECASTAQVTILVQGSNLNAYANASPEAICLGDTTQLHAITIGGAPNRTYMWDHANTLLSAPNVAEPLANPTETTTYQCTIDDGLSTIVVSVTVTVNYPEYAEETQYICPDDVYPFYGQSCSAEGDYEYKTTTAQGCEKVITLHLHHYPSYDNAHTTTQQICPGESYPFHGTNYSTTGLYSANLHTTHGCDSIVWLDLTVRPANDTIIENKDICLTDTLIWHGQAYFTDGDEAYFDDTDINGCLLVHKLHLRVGQYQSPPESYDPNVYQCVPYDEEPYYYWDIAEREYHEDTQDTIVIQNPNPLKCDYLYTLNLKFHKESFITDTLTVCDEYYWPITGQKYTQTNHHIEKPYQIPFGPNNSCDSIFVLDLTVNHKDISSIEKLNQCDQYEWQFGWNNESYVLSEQGDTYTTKTIPTHLGCDSTVTMHLQLDYTPSFPKVEGHQWVVGGSEFQFSIENYWINTRGTHTTDWHLYNPDGSLFNKWEIIPYGDNYDKCQLYIYTFELDSIELRAHTLSNGECDCGEDTKSLWIHCTFYDVDETADSRSVEIFPNPNDGNMTLSFENMLGEVEVKVFNLTGTLMDHFTLHNGFGHQTHTYQSGKLPEGIYFFQFLGKGGLLTRKVIIM